MTKYTEGTEAGIKEDQQNVFSPVFSLLFPSETAVSNLLATLPIEIQPFLFHPRCFYPKGPD